MGFADFFRKKSSSNVAKDRLKMVLVSDRANCSPDIMEQIKNDIIHVLSKYVEIDLDGLDIKISRLNRRAPMVWCRHFLQTFRLKT